MSRATFLSGDIVLIHDAPFTNRLAVKARPVIVVSGSQFNRSSPDVIVAPISSNIRYNDPMQVVIENADPYFPRTGLKQSSAVKCGAIFAYSQVHIARKLGVAHPNILKKVREKIIDILT